MGKVKGMVAGKTVARKVEVERCRLNPAMRKIMEKRAKEELAKKKQTDGLDVKSIQKQVEEMLRKDD